VLVDNDYSKNIELSLELEASVELNSEHDLARTFRQTAEDADLADSLRGTLKWEVWMFDLRLPDDGQGPLLPIMEGPGGSYPPTVESFPEESVAYFRERLCATSEEMSKARIADLLWTRDRDYRMAQMAADAYVGLAKRSLQKDGASPNGAACQYLVRSASLSTSTKYDAVGLADCIIDAMSQWTKEERVGFLWRLAEGAAHKVQKCKLRDQLDEIIALADSLAARKSQHRQQERVAVEAAIVIAQNLKETDRVNDLRVRLARSIEAESAERANESALIQSALAQQALRMYADLGLSADVERLKRIVHEATAKAADETSLIEVKQEVPVEQLEEQARSFLRYFRDRSPVDHLYWLGADQNLWPKWEDVVERTKNRQGRFPPQYLMPQIRILPDGRPLPSPSESSAKSEWDAIQLYLQDTLLLLYFLDIRINVYREEGAWSPELLATAMSNGALFEPRDIDAIRPGLTAFEEGRYWEALHVLIPQVERVIRNLARHLGLDVWSYDHQSGELKWTTLGSILAYPQVKTMLAELSSDFARELTYLLVDSRGGNLRNDVAHGIIGNDSTCAVWSLLTILILLALANFQYDTAQGTDADSETPEDA